MVPCWQLTTNIAVCDFVIISLSQLLVYCFSRRKFILWNSMSHRKLLSRISQIDLERLAALEVPIPQKEYDRLLVLRQCNLLDTQTDESYDRFTSLCARYFKVPIVIISLLDTDRQWFKSRVGLAAQQTSRDVAFCAYTILEETPRVMVVPDAHDDLRFRNNPLVIGPPFIHFYAGASLIIEGIKVGTICLINDQPNHCFTSAQKEIFIGIADTISEMMIDRRQRLLDAHLNGVQMHQSLLTLFRQPFQILHQSFDQLQAQLKKLPSLSLMNTNDRLLWLNFFDQITHWEVSVEHVSHVLEIMLRYITRIVLLLQHQQDPEVRSLSSIENGCYLLDTHHQELLTHNNMMVKCCFLPWKHDVWVQQLHELFTCFHIPIASVPYRTNTFPFNSNNNSNNQQLKDNHYEDVFHINTHPDVLYLVLLAITEQLSLVNNNHTPSNKDNSKRLSNKVISDLQVIQDDEDSLMHMVISLQQTATSSSSSVSSTNIQQAIALDTSTLDAIDTLLSYIWGKLYCETVPILTYNSTHDNHGNNTDHDTSGNDSIRNMSTSTSLYVTKVHITVPSSNQSCNSNNKKNRSPPRTAQPPPTMFSSHAYNSFLYKQSYLAEHTTMNRPKLEHLVEESFVAKLATFHLPLIPVLHDMNLHKNTENHAHSFTLNSNGNSTKDQKWPSSPVLHNNGHEHAQHDLLSVPGGIHISQLAFQLWSQWIQPHLSSVVPINNNNTYNRKVDIKEEKKSSLFPSPLISPLKHNKVAPVFAGGDDNVTNITDNSNDNAT